MAAEDASPVTLLHLGPFLRAYVLRSIGVWVGIRLALAWGGVGNPGLLTEAAIVALVAGTLLLDARRRGEDRFLANLGISSGSIVLAGLAVAALLEVLVP